MTSSSTSVGSRFSSAKIFCTASMSSFESDSFMRWLSARSSSPDKAGDGDVTEDGFFL